MTKRQGVKQMSLPTRKEIYSTLLNLRKGYACWLSLLVLLAFSFNAFAWSQFLDIVNNSPAPIKYYYNGLEGNAWGACGENASTCTMPANSLDTLKLTNLGGAS